MTTRSSIVRHPRGDKIFATGKIIQIWLSSSICANCTAWNSLGRRDKARVSTHESHYSRPSCEETPKRRVKSISSWLKPLVHLRNPHSPAEKANELGARMWILEKLKKDWRVFGMRKGLQGQAIQSHLTAGGLN